MASINGITVKNLKRFAGHEGESCFQGNLYLGNKKIGLWSQDSWGGPDRYNFDFPYSEDKLQKRVIELNPDKAVLGNYSDGKKFVLDYELDFLLNDFLLLNSHEKEFKDSLKKGFSGTMILTDGYHQVLWNLREQHTKLSDDKLIDLCSDMIETAKKDHHFYANKEHEIKIFRSLDDFNIGVPISLKEIMNIPSIDEQLCEAKSSRKKQTLNTNKVKEERECL